MQGGIMESLGVVKEFLFFFQTLGPWGIIGFLWWQGQRDFQRFKEILTEENKKRDEDNKKWEERFNEMKNMYENNVELVKRYEKVTGDQQGIILLNTQAWTKLTTIIETRGII